MKISEEVKKYIKKRFKIEKEVDTEQLTYINFKHKGETYVLYANHTLNKYCLTSCKKALNEKQVLEELAKL